MKTRREGGRKEAAYVQKAVQKSVLHAVEPPLPM